MKLGVGGRPWAGLDIGTYSVKLVSLQPGTSRRQYAEAVIPRALSSEEMPAPAILAGLIDDCMTRVGQSPRGFGGISIGVSGPDVIVKEISLPFMDESEIAGALRFESRKHLPFDVQTLVLDHQVLGRNTSERKLEVLLATVSQQRLDQALAPLRELGVEADIVDAAPLALANSLTSPSAREGPGEPDAQLLLDLGHRGSWLTLRHKGFPFFSRRLDWGGVLLTQTIAAKLGSTVERAETWKLDPGASLAEASAEADAARWAVEQLAEELRRSLAFYGTIAHIPSALALRLSGGTARLTGLPERLGELLDIPVTIFSPLDTTERGVRIQAGGPQFAQAFGLALRAA